METINTQTDLPDSSLAKLAHEDPELVTFTLDQVANVFGVSRRVLSDYVSSGRLHAVRFGKKKRVTLAELRRFLAGRKLTDQTSYDPLVLGSID